VRLAARLVDPLRVLRERLGDRPGEDVRVSLDGSVRGLLRAEPLPVPEGSERSVRLVVLLALLLAGCSSMDATLLDTRRAERAVSLEAARTLRDFAGVATSATARLEELRPGVAALDRTIEDVAGITHEVRDHGALLVVALALLLGVLLGRWTRREVRTP